MKNYITSKYYHPRLKDNGPIINDGRQNFQNIFQIRKIFFQIGKDSQDLYHQGRPRVEQNYLSLHGRCQQKRTNFEKVYAHGH